MAKDGENLIAQHGEDISVLCLKYPLAAEDMFQMVPDGLLPHNLSMWNKFSSPHLSEPL